MLHNVRNVLREFSSVLWVATDSRASLRSVTVVLPHTWRTDALTCSTLTTVSPIAVPITGHIRVSGPHPLFGRQPWTQQTQGCGRPGDFIQFGGDLLRVSTNDSHALAARLLLAEWAKFRWGVFEEHGHGGDPLYPPTFRDPDSHQWVASACADGNVQGTKCDSAQPGCTFTPDTYGNAHLQASLLSFPELPSIRKFCDDSTHNKVAPTKHNAICGGRSTWEIISQTLDFASSSSGMKMSSNSSRGPEPQLNFVQDSSPRYVFLIEDTATMNIQRRWEYLRKAMRRVVVYDIPDGSHVSVVTFNSKPRTVAPLTYIESEDSDYRQRVGSSLPRNPSHVPESHKCIMCGLQEALINLEEGRNSASSEGASIIIITTGSGPAPPHDVQEMIRLVKARSLRIELVVYPLTERRHGYITPKHGLESVVEASGGSIFTVMDEGVGNDSKVSMLVALMDALLAVVSRSSPPEAPGAPVLVHNHAFPGGKDSMSAGSFALDESLGSDARFSVYYYDLNHVGNTIQLTAPSGQTLASVNTQEEDGDVNMIFVKMEKAERGLWSYTVENRADSHQGLYIQVTARHSVTEGLQVRVWTSNGSKFKNASDPSVATIIYASISEGMSPVLNARVMATVQRLGTNTSGHVYKPFNIDLKDNGVGDPDITGNDGVYSRYLPPLLDAPGHYIISVDLDYNNGLAVVAAGPPRSRHKPQHSAYYPHIGYDQRTEEPGTCCGSKLQHLHTRRAAPFVRHLTWGVMEVVGNTSVHDIIPPCRILDLRVDMNETSHEIHLSWTAPGDDWDNGRADRYEAVVAPTYEQARAFQGDRLTGLPKPLPVGTLHSTTLYWTRYEELWYVTIRAMDESNNKGGFGNIAALWVPRPPTTYEITTRTQPGLTTSGNYTIPSELGSGRPIGLSGLQFEDVAMIFGIIGGFILVVIILVSYCYFIAFRRRKKQQIKDFENVPGDGSANIMVKSGSLGMEDDGRSNESIDSAIKEKNQSADGRPLSPVPFWDASTLLQEHERRLSVNSNVHDETVVSQNIEGHVPLHAPYPDVTVTDYRPCDPPPYTPEENPTCPCTVPGPDYTSYSASWDEPLTGHLLSRARGTVGSTNAATSQIPQVDRKRRNVTQ
ncbi:unnamed protein product, partial [Meganyctiphanes norvegica]